MYPVTVAMPSGRRERVLRCVRLVEMAPYQRFLGRPEPPFRTGLCFTREVFFVSPRFLRGPSIDRPETLPHGPNLAEFYNKNPTPKIPEALPPQKNWLQNMQNFGQFCTNSDFDRESPERNNTFKIGKRHKL